MPRPEKGESRDEFVSRAIKMLMGEGLNQKAAVGKAEGMYTHYSKKRGYGAAAGHPKGKK